MKKNTLLALSFLFILFGINGCGNDWDDNETVGIANKNVITKNSELFKLLEKVASGEEDPIKGVVCLDFIYPFSVIIYNEALERIDTKVLGGDLEFSAFLEALPIEHSISISYPISTTLSDGTTFSVNNNDELKLAIDSCSKEDIVIYCNSMFGGTQVCIWKIPFTEDKTNKYASGIFETNNDGTLNFKFDGVTYNGVWTFLFVDDKLHMNINLSGTSEVARDWNIDREIIFTTDEITIINTPKNIILRKSCQSVTEYRIGENGPADGIVFYDKGEYTNGWRYMEAAPVDLGQFEWGCNGSAIQPNYRPEIGDGLFNSVTVANYHDGLENYYTNPSICNALNNGSVASKKALLYMLNGRSDWFLPSEKELKLLYDNLYLRNLGGFSNTHYWSSTEENAILSKAVDFTDGSVISVEKIPLTPVSARAIRYF